MACLSAATFEALTTGALATASSIFCRDRAESVRVTVSPVCDVDALAADASPCGLSVTTPLLFEPLTGARGSAVEYALILTVTEILLGPASISPCQGYRQGLDELEHSFSRSTLCPSYRL